MSWMRQQGNGDGEHGNGLGNGYRPHYDLDVSSRDTSADERSRSRGAGAAAAGGGRGAAGGGYGGLGRQPDYSVQRMAGPAQLDRRQANRRSQDRGWSASRSRSRPGARFGEGSRQVEEVLKYINSQWSFMSSDSCVPVKVALQLMDPSSLGLADQYEQFQDMHQQLQSALKAIVNEHHQGFNSSIGTFHQIQGSIQASQQRVRGLKQSLVEAKSNLSTTRPELKAFATSSQNYDQMLQMLGYMEELQTMPERIEAQISEKKFLGAVATLQDALKLMRKPELEDIGALSDLQVYLGNQEHSVTDILIEELHSHLYLKSPYCEDRWKEYASRNANAGSTMLDLDRRNLYQFLGTLDSAERVVEDSSQNPEADSFSYIQILLESLDRMSRLDVAVDAIEQRLPVELFRVVEKCYNEIEQRHPEVSRNANQHPPNGLDLSIDDENKKEILDDMLSSLYAKFEAIAEGHRVVHDVISSMLQRQGVREPSLLRSFHELWKLYQSEIRSLLHDHLSNSGNLGHRTRQDDDAGANIFKPHARDKTKRLFKLADTDTTSTSLSTEREDLDYILKLSVPGLVSANQKSANQTNESSKLPDRSATGHKLLVQPSVFNMGILLPPSLAFLTRLRDVVPQNSDVVLSTLTSFLDDFLVNVFLPQMEETLADQCMLASAQLDAFQEDPNWEARAPKAIFKGIIQLYDLVEAFCKMLDSLPQDQAFSHLIIAQLRSYLTRCSEFFRSLVARPQLDNNAVKTLRSAATFAQQGDLYDLLNSLFQATGQESEQLSEQETALLLTSAKARPLRDLDLITDRKATSQLCTLYTSLRWFTARLIALRNVDPNASNAVGSSLTRHQKRRWTHLGNGLTDAKPYLPLDSRSAVDFDAVTTAFTDLSALILRTLHLEVRLQTLQGIARALGTTYQLGQPYNDPDPAIIALNRTILAMDEELSARLPSRQYQLCVTNLADLADQALCSYASAVPAMDAHGNARMQLNILVLQQNLKEMDALANLAQAARFWELWDEGPDAVLAACNEGLGKIEGRELLRLCYSTSAAGTGQGGHGLQGQQGQGQKSQEEVYALLERIPE